MTIKRVAIGVTVALVISVLGYCSYQYDQRWRRHCHAMGGHVVNINSSTYGTYVSSSGKVGSDTSTTTTTLCLSHNGQILDSE